MMPQRSKDAERSLSAIEATTRHPEAHPTGPRTTGRRTRGIRSPLEIIRPRPGRDNPSGAPSKGASKPALLRIIEPLAEINQGIIGQAPRDCLKIWGKHIVIRTADGAKVCYFCRKPSTKADVVALIGNEANVPIDW